MHAVDNNYSNCLYAESVVKVINACAFVRFKVKPIVFAVVHGTYYRATLYYSATYATAQLCPSVRLLVR